MSDYKHFSKMYILVSCCAPISLRSVCLTCMHSQPSLWSLTENLKAEAFALLTAKWKYFHVFLTFTDGEDTCEM